MSSWISSRNFSTTAIKNIEVRSSESLVELVLKGYCLDAKEFLRVLARFVIAEDFSLQCCRDVDDDMFGHLHRLKKLQFFRLDRPLRLINDGLVESVRHLPNLEMEKLSLYCTTSKQEIDIDYQFV